MKSIFELSNKEITVVQCVEEAKKTIKKIDTLNKKLQKNNIPVITYKQEPCTVKVSELYPSMENGDNVYLDAVKITVKLSIDKFVITSDYEFVGVIDHKEHMVYNNTSINIESFRDRNICDACHTNHAKSKTIILQNKKTNELIQVGSSCISKFIKIDVEEILKLQNVLFPAEPSKISIRKMNDYMSYDIYSVIASSIRNIKKEGFKKINKYNGYEYDHDKTEDVSTKERVLDDLDYKNEKRFIPTDKEKEETENVIDYIHNLNDSPFNLNVKRMVRNGYVTFNTIGYIPPVVNNYFLDKNTPKQEEPTKETKKSQYVGNIGDKITVDLKLTKQLQFRNSYTGGYSISYVYWYFFEDKDGNVFLWKTDKTIGVDVDDEEEIKLKGTIKDHSIYKGVKQTILTRCKIV